MAYPTQPPPAQGRKLSTGAIVAIVIGAVVVLICGICGVVALANGVLTGVNQANNPATTRPATATKPATTHTIRFEVTSPSATATLINWSTLEDSALLNNEKLPWSKEVVLEEKFGLVGVNASVASGKIACKLYVDGVMVDEGESDSVVNCSDTVR